MRIHTEAFNYIPIPIWAIVTALVIILVAVVYLYNWCKGMSTGLKGVCWTAMYTGLFFLAASTLANNAAVADAGALTNDLKEQLGIEKVSYDDEYRELTGEKDGTVVFCVLTEEGDRGNIYEVICK